MIIILGSFFGLGTALVRAVAEEYRYVYNSGLFNVIEDKVCAKC